MRSTKRLLTGGAIVAAAILIVAAPLTLAADQADWHFNGTVIEACSCKMFCPCYFNTSPAGTHEHGPEHFCKFNMAYKVNDGHHGETDLTGVRFWVAGDLGPSWEDGTTEWAIVTFATGTLLAPGARLVVVSNQLAFEFRYGAGTATIAGTYTGNFRNKGENVRLEAADTSAIADFTYGDSSPWPDDADGTGYSLIFAGVDPTDPVSWRSSTAIGGNPGRGAAIGALTGGLIGGIRRQSQRDRQEADYRRYQQQQQG